jgi:acetoin utilization deacetylase AcuC-like enzyme
VPRALREDPELFGALVHAEGRHATEDELILSHDAAYVASVRSVAEAGGGQLDADTVASEGSWDAATAATGCLLDAVDMTMDGRAQSAFCGVRPPGHHALRDRAMGFCLFGNVAIAAQYARKKHALERVLIVDWDVHHGNGTQALVEPTKDIRFISMHQWPWYPGTGPASDRGPHKSVWNVPMPAAQPAHAYRSALLAAVDAATADFTPDLVIISAGFDSLAGDPLGGFTLEPADFVSLTSELVSRANSWCKGRIVSALEGGYDPARLGTACVAHMRALSGMATFGS